MCACLMSALLAALLLFPSPGPALSLKTGALLRLHVVACDDTPAMQAVKYPVRDAVRETYAASPLRTGSMLADAALLLPCLSRAADDAAREAGFPGPVTVSLALAVFPETSLDGAAIAAGRYPALIVRLGEGRGHNWWGLLDPEAALSAAAISPDDGEIVWDWSLRGLLRALLGWIGGTDYAP